MNKFQKTKLFVFYKEDKEIYDKIQNDKVNFQRLIRSLLTKWYYDKDETDGK